MLTDLAKNRVRRFAEDEDGAVAIIVSLMLTMLIGFVALGVDAASLYRDRSLLQQVTDLTAVSAMAEPDDAPARATHTLARNGTAAAALDSLETGRLLRNPAIAPQDRFTALPAGSPGINAVRVVLQEEAPLHFARAFTTETHVSLTRTATASRTGAASFALTSHVAHLDATDLNQLITQNYGANAAIGSADMQIMAQTSVTLGTLLDALASSLGSDARNPAEVLTATTTVADMIDALSTILPAPLAEAVSGLARAVDTSSVSVASLVGGIDPALGLTATDFLSEIEISALDVIRAVVAAGGAQASIALTTDAGVPGILATDVTLTAAEPPAQSGWVALGEEGVQLHRAAMNLQTDIRADPNILGNLGIGVQATRIHLPLYAELAGASATLEEIGCSVTNPQAVAASFSTAPTALHPQNGTALAALYLGALPEDADRAGSIDPADLGFADLLDVTLVIDLPLLPDVTIAGLTLQARSHATAGRSQSENIRFTHDEIAAGTTTKTYGSGDLLSTAIMDLLSPANTELRIKPGQEGLVSGLAAPLVADLLTLLPTRLLSALASPVDAVLGGALGSVGLQMGAGELTLTGHHCEPIRLVQ